MIILIRGRLLIQCWGLGWQGEEAESRRITEEEESSRRAVVDSEYTIGAV